MHRSLSVLLIGGSLFTFACVGEEDGADTPTSDSLLLAAVQDGGARQDGACLPVAPHAPHTTWSPITDAQVPVTFGDANAYCNSSVVHCPPTKGPIPDDAYSANGRVIFENVPDFVTALGGKKGGPVGWVSRYDLLCGAETIDVLDDSLTKVIGQMVPNKGFVPAKH